MRDNVGGGERLLSERESSLLGLRSEANKLRGVLALIPEDAQQLAFQLNTFAQNCSRLHLPAMAQSRKVTASLATLAEVLETVAPDCAKHAMLLKKHADSALGSSKGDAAIQAKVARCVKYAESLEDCGRMTLDSKAVSKLLGDAEDCELRSGLNNPLEMLAGALDCCHKIPNLPGHILSQLAEVEDLIPGQAMHAIQEEVEDDKESATASDLPSIAKLTERLDDILAQVVAATQPLHLDPRKVELAITGVEAVNKAIVFLKELPRTVEPLVAKLEMVSEVTSFGARTARELSHSVKNIIRNMHSENTVAKLARQSRAVLAGALCSCQCRPEGLNYSFAPLMIAIFYVLGIAALVVSIVVFMIALLRGLEESLPTLGVGSMVCLIAGVSSCVLGVATSFVLRALARVELIGEDDESKELEEAVLQIKEAREADMKKRVKLLEAQADWRTKGDIETGQTNQLPHSTVHVADMPMLQQMDGIHVDNNARLIFGDSDKGIVAEICSLGSKMPYPELLASGVAARPVSAAGLRGARKDRKATPQKVMQELFEEGRKPVSRQGSGSPSSSRRNRPHPLLPSSRPETRGGLEPVISARDADDMDEGPSVMDALMTAIGGSNPIPKTEAAQGFSIQPPPTDKVKPSAEELMQFARYMGIDPIFESDLLWIAEQAYNAPLPAIWVETQDGDGNVYYYNSMTGVSTWSHPLEDHFRSLVAEMKKDKTGKKASANKRTGTLPPIKRRGPFEDAHGGNANHILDGSEADMTDESHNTSLDMSRSLDMSTSKRGKDQWWDSNAPANSQPFIRSFGRSGNLESSLRAARGETAIAPPPLPGIQPHPASVPSATVGETPLRVQHAPAQEKTSRKDKARKKKQPSHQLP